MKRIAIVESNDTARIFTPRGELRFTAIANRRRHAPASDQPHSNQAELVVYPAENRQSTNAGMFAPHCHLLTRQGSDPCNPWEAVRQIAPPPTFHQ